MPIRLDELAAALKAELVRGDAAKTIAGVSSLKDALASQLAPFTDKTYAAQLEKTQAGVILTRTGMQDVIPASFAVLTAADPEMAFIQAIRLFSPEVKETAGVDSRAVVEEGVELGSGVHVGAYAVVRKGTRVGAGSVIMAHAYVGRDCVLGDGCTIYPRATLYDGIKLGNRVMIHSGAVIGADGFGYKFRGGRHVKVPQVGIVEIGDDVEIGANTCIDRGALGPTRIGFGTKIDNLVQIGHNNVVGNHVILCGQVALAGSCQLDDYVVLGGNAGVADHIHVGKGAKAGAKAGIGKDVPPGEEVWGMFATERSNAFRSLAIYNKLPELQSRVKALEKEIEKLKKS
jgi:UDP-3-O-[3-hydroxymyristoyl] glucosamine N-acyltransferase